MGGFLIMIVLLLWGLILFGAGYYLAFWIRKRWIRTLVGLTFLVGLFTWPIRDELKGAEEFETLCKSGGIYQISPKTIGKKLDLRYGSTDRTKLAGHVRPIEESTITYTDVATGDVVATAKAYFAKGGWLVRHGWARDFGGGDGALWGRSQCFPPVSAREQARLRDITNRVVN